MKLRGGRSPSVTRRTAIFIFIAANLIYCTFLFRHQFRYRPLLIAESTDLPSNSDPEGPSETLFTSEEPSEQPSSWPAPEDQTQGGDSIITDNEDFEPQASSDSDSEVDHEATDEETIDDVKTLENTEMRTKEAPAASKAATRIRKLIEGVRGGGNFGTIGDVRKIKDDSSRPLDANVSTVDPSEPDTSKENFQETDGALIAEEDQTSDDAEADLKTKNAAATKMIGEKSDRRHEPTMAAVEQMIAVPKQMTTAYETGTKFSTSTYPPSMKYQTVDSTLLQTRSSASSITTQASSSIIENSGHAISTTLPTSGEKIRERYVAYLPHSGFHNQRVALENALMIAFLLNRTLLVPPCSLGHAVPWSYHDRLYKMVTRRQENDRICATGIATDVRSIFGNGDTTTCERHNDHTVVPWKYIYDLDAVKPLVRMRTRENLTYEWMRETLGVEKNDIQFVDDALKYDYRVYDSSEAVSPVGKYNRRVDADDLATSTASVIHFGSLFGSSRVALSRKDTKDFRKLVATAMVYAHPKLVEAAERCVERLGGAGTYLGLHLRVGDGAFLHEKAGNIKTAVSDLNDNLMVEGHLSKPSNASIVSDGDPDEMLRGMETITSHFRPSERRLPLATCLDHVTRLKTLSVPSPILYLATDSQHPEQDPAFAPLYSRWPCIVTLSEFSPIISEIIAEEYFEETAMKKYLIPMLDLMVAAKGRLFVGTRGSTFSGYAHNLHAIYSKGGL